MPFISYAQNLEDVMLYRALRDVKRGFYVDVGANSPDLHSVTRALYERGWRGINIEPVAVFHEQLVASRPDDINLAIAIGDRSGVANFYDIPDTGLSTVDGEVARQHLLSGYRIVDRQVPIETLDNVFESHGIELVHFLKIDVEGHEGAVLRGLSLKAVRPWIIVVEATAPLSQDQSHLAWDLLLTEQSYSFVYFDGLNRYYVAEEKAGLAESFSSPPNIFDDWIRAHDWAAHELVGNLSRRITGEQEAYQSERDVRRLEAEARQAEVAVRQSEVEMRRSEVVARQDEEDHRRAETDCRRAEIEVRQAEGDRRQAEAECREAEVEVRQGELAKRETEAVIRLAEAELRREEISLREEEISLREKEADSRRVEILIRQKEAEARQGEIEAKHWELAQQEAEAAARLAAWTAETESRMAEWRRITDENGALRHRVAHLEAVVASLEGYIADVRTSSSWRLTAPVRGVKRMLEKLGRAARLRVSPRPLLVRLARKTARWAADRPAIKSAALPILLSNPVMERRARALLARERPPTPPPHPIEAPPLPSPPASPDQAGTRTNAGVATSLTTGSLSPAERIIEAAIRRAQARARRAGA
jgi:FkbM family methyltransferase